MVVGGGGGCHRALYVHCHFGVGGVELGWRLHMGQGGVGGGNGGGGGVARIYREEALDTKVSSMVASTTPLGRRFQSLIVLGRKNSCTVSFAGMSLNCPS